MTDREILARFKDKLWDKAFADLSRANSSSLMTIGEKTKLLTISEVFSTMADMLGKALNEPVVVPDSSSNDSVNN